MSLWENIERSKILKKIPQITLSKIKIKSL